MVAARPALFQTNWRPSCAILEAACKVRGPRNTVNYLVFCHFYFSRSDTLFLDFVAETEACVRQLRAIRAPSGSKPGVAWRVFARPGASWAIVGQSSRSLGPVCGLSRDLLGTVLTPCELSLGPVVLPWGHFEPKGAPRMRAFQARKAVKKNRVFYCFLHSVPHTNLHIRLRFGVPKKVQPFRAFQTLFGGVYFSGPLLAVKQETCM